MTITAILLLSATAQNFGSTELMSATDSGALSAGSTQPELRWTALSADGRFIAFTSGSPDLVPGDGNGVADVFLRDTVLGTLRRVSLGASGQEGNGHCRGCDVSDDGRFVAFTSAASNLVPGDANGSRDVFLRDMAMGSTELISAGPGGGPGDSASSIPHISADGEWVAFESAAMNLGPPDPSARVDVYLREVSTGAMDRIVALSGDLDALSAKPRLSADGRFVAFESSAKNLLPGGNPNGIHVARWDRITGAIEIVTRDVGGAVAGGTSRDACISASGDLVAFRSFESDLVPGDTNGREDIFVRHVGEGWTERVSLTAAGDQIVGAASRAPAISGDGRFTSFFTTANGVVPGDMASTGDVFRRDRGHGEAFAGPEYCLSTPNSSGADARTVLIGSPRLPAQDLTLVTVGLPASQFGFYFTSTATGFVPGFGGSQGNLCLGMPIVRLDGFILNSGPLGRVSLALPFGQLPIGATFSPGQRWNFQYWFRDVIGGSPTSNTSSAAAVLWRP